MVAEKRLLRKLLIIVILFVAGIFYAHAQNLSGIWLTKNGISKIQIYQAKDGLYYGKLVWTKDQSAKAKSFHGKTIMTGFKKESETIYKGKVHNPRKDDIYNCTMKIKNADELDMRGYIGISLIGRTEQWTRVSK